MIRVDQGIPITRTLMHDTQKCTNMYKWSEYAGFIISILLWAISSFCVSEVCLNENENDNGRLHFNPNKKHGQYTTCEMIASNVFLEWFDYSKESDYRVTAFHAKKYMTELFRGFCIE